jgi:hypothetical protein
MPFIEVFKIIQQMTDEDIEDNMSMAEKRKIKYEANKKYVAEYNKNKYNTDPDTRAKINKSTLEYNNNKYRNDPDFRDKKKEYYKQYYINKRLAREKLVFQQSQII